MAHPACVAEVAGEPLVVVGKVMDAIGQHTIAHLQRVIDTRAGFHLPRGIMISLEPREDVPGHVPHVRDARRGLAALANGADGALGVFVIPKVNPVVVTGMHRVHFEDFADELVDGFVV